MSLARLELQIRDRSVKGLTKGWNPKQATGPFFPGQPQKTCSARLSQGFALTGIALTGILCPSLLLSEYRYSATFGSRGGGNSTSRSLGWRKVTVFVPFPKFPARAAALVMFDW